MVEAVFPRLLLFPNVSPIILQRRLSQSPSDYLSEHHPPYGPSHNTLRQEHERTA